MRPGRKSCTTISRRSRGGCERHSDGRLKKRTGFGPHPGERKPKPDAAETPVAHGDFLPESRGVASGIREGRLKKRTGFGPHPEGQKPKPDAAGISASASTFQRHVQLLKPEDTATMQKEMASAASPFR